MTKYMIIKICSIGLVLFIGKATALAQDQDVRCEVNSLDYNLSQDEPGYGTKFGSFSLFINNEEMEEKEVPIHAIKFYELPRTKLILSVLVHVSKYEKLDSTQLVLSMVLGKRRVAFSPGFFDGEEWAENTVGLAQAVYPVAFFDRGGEGMLSTGFFGKKKPVQIMMTCKKAGS